MPKKILIVGANASGVDAAVAARKNSRDVEITLVTREGSGAYSRCGLPFVLSGRIPSFENLIVYPSSFYSMMKLDLRLETTVVNIDTETKMVDIETKEGKKETLQYDSLILALGASPFSLPIDGFSKEGVFNLHTMRDGQRLALAMKDASHAVVIGAGLVGLEAAEAFTEKGIKTTIVEILPSILPKLLDQDISQVLQKNCEEKGVSFILGKSANAIVGDSKVRAVNVGGEEIPADIVINAVGVRPNVELAKKAGITIGESGGIKTNIRMQTNIPDIFAVGDCAETTHAITHRPALPMLGSTAVREGKAAGINASGGYATFPGTLFSWVSKIFEFEVGATGLTEFWAAKASIDVAVGKISSQTRAPYYPGGMPIRVKIVVEKETRQVVGGEIIGGEDVTQRINALSLAIQNNMTIYELAKADTCYSPSVCETWEPIVLAADLAIRRLSG